MALAKYDTEAPPQRGGALPANLPNPELFNTAELLALRNKINEMLGNDNLNDLDMSTELLLQYRIVSQLISDTSSDHTIPLNQRAQIINSAASLLTTLAKMQVDVHNAQRVQRIHGAVVTTLQKLDKERRLELTPIFLAELKKSLGLDA